MPEGPTVHRLADELNEMFAGKTLAASSPQGRFAAEAKRVSGSVLRRVEPHGKHLFYHFAQGRIVHVHLGLYGKMRTTHDGSGPRGAVRLRLSHGATAVDLNGPNQCELIEEPDVTDIRARLGPDPLRADGKIDAVRDRILASPSPVGVLLMDQSVISGLGNIYRCELLWLIKVHPRSPGNTLTAAEVGRLWSLSKRLMKLAVRTGRIITHEQTAKHPPKRLKAEQRFNIYKKATCPRCGHAVTRFTMAGRNVFACSGCQIERGGGQKPKRKK